MPAPDIIEFITDPQLLGLSLSEAQEVLLRGVYALPLTAAQRALFHACTGRAEPPGAPFGEVTVVAGARSGKDSRIAAPVVCYEALFGGHEHELAKGELGVIPLVAQGERGTKVAFGYVKAYLTGSPLLASSVAEVLASEIVLANGLTISCFPCTVRSLRSWSIPAGVMDELGFYRLEGQADADVEIQASIRRGMLGFTAPKLIKVSTPYMKSGVLYDDFKRYFGQDSPDALAWTASSRLMNPTLKVERLERERRLDPDRYAREYLAEFSEDLEAFLPAAWVEGAIMRGRHELPPRLGVRYFAAVDPSGGGADAFTLSIVHVESSGGPERTIVQDVIRGWRRRGAELLDLTGVVRDMAQLLKTYQCSWVTGDRYAGDWVRQAFRAAGVLYREAELDKSAAYGEVAPLFAQGRVALLDHPELAREFKMLERRPRPGGKIVVDHPHGRHDDHANAFALAAAIALKGTGARLRPALGGVRIETTPESAYDPAVLLARPTSMPF